MLVTNYSELTFATMNTDSMQNRLPLQIPYRLRLDAVVYNLFQILCNLFVCFFAEVHPHNGMLGLVFLRSLAYCISFWHRMLPILLSAAYRIPE